MLLKRIFPFLRWRRLVTSETLRVDGLAGLAGAILVVPQGVAFAAIAGMPLEYGLYAAIVPAVVAALFGSSFHLVSGPTTAASVVMFSALSQIAEPGSAHYVSLAITVAFLVGVVQAVLGFARLGVIVNFVSHTVVVAFTAGAAVLIATKQLGAFLGVTLPKGLAFYETVHQAVSAWQTWQPATIAVGLMTIASGVLSRRFLPQIPYMISALLGGSLVGVLIITIQPQAANATIGALPQQLPPLSMPIFSLGLWSDLAGLVFAMTILGLTEAVSISRSIATRSGQVLDANQEFIGQGFSNIVGSFFSSFTATGSFNRSAANFEAGAKTPIAAGLAGLLVIPVLFVVAPVTAYLPYAAMSGLLLMIAWSLVDLKALRKIIRASKAEAAIIGITLGSAVLVDLERAILFGVLLSLLLYLRRTSRPRILSRAPDPASPKRKFSTSTSLPECPQLKMIRVDDSLYFGAVNYVREIFQRLREHYPDQRHLLLLSQGIAQVDVAGAELLVEEARARRAIGGSLSLYQLKESARDVINQGGYMEQIQPAGDYLSKGEAIKSILPTLDPQVCASCSQRIFLECAKRPG
ncbi:MAG: SulP family inorganic anion transporter, partial [Arenicellales bacterium]